MKKTLLLLVATIVFMSPAAVMFVSPTQVYASTVRDVQYEHALSRAVSRDPAIIPLDRESRVAGAHARDLLAEYLQIVNVDREVAEAIYGQRLIALAERDRLQRERERMVLEIELRLRNYLANIASSEQNIILLEKTLAFQENMHEQATLRLEHGMASEVEVRESELTVEQTRLNLESVTLVLENERQSLNRLIRQPANVNIRVIYDIYGYDPLPADTERFVSTLTSRDHNFLDWVGEVETRRFEWQRQLDDPAVDNRYMRLQHQLAVLERNMAERMAETNVRGAIAEWERNLEQQTALEAELAQARADYSDMQNRLEAGLVTQIQVDAMALAYANAQNQLARHAYDMWIARLRLEHTYAL